MDLGTIYSCVGIWKNTKIVIIPNDIGERTTPSVVCFTENERLIGKAAKNNNKNYKNKIYDSKRLIGRNFEDKEIQEDMKYWPFKVIKDNNNKPLFEVEYKKEKVTFYPEQISAMILSKLKNNAEAFCGCEIKDAIITVPAYFNDIQRQCTKIAGKIAGLNVIRIINEPTAAAIAYGLDNNEEEKYILVFDFGGGTLDVTILLLNKNIFEVKSTCGNSHLGGNDLDNELIKYCINEFNNTNYIDLSYNKRAINRLKKECESLKILLSASLETSIELANIVDGEDLNLTITRFEFENICQKYFDECFVIIEKALKDANLKKEEIDDIVLVGGSSRIPKIQEMITIYFGKNPHKEINPDEAIASGAAILGATIIDNINDDKIKDLKIIDITPLSLGIGLVNGEMDVIIPKNTTIPCKKTINYRTVKDNQKKIVLKIYQGEREFSKNNIYLGKCVLNNIPPKPKGNILIQVTFSIDINGVLNVLAIEKSGGIEKTIVLNMIYNGLNEEKIEELNKKNNEINEEDKKILESNKKRFELMETCYYYQKDGSQKQKQMASEIIEWAKKNRYEEKKEYEEKLREIKDCH